MLSDATNSLKTSVSNGKSAVASEITDKGVSTSATAEFSTMASNIRAISTGYKVNTETWTFYDSPTSAVYKNMKIPDSAIGKNIKYAICVTKTTAYITVIFDGSNWTGYANSSMYNFTYTESTGVINTSSGIWVSSSAIKFNLIIYI